MTDNTDGFSAAAPRWWGIAAQWLAWRPEEFWSATPSELRGALSDPNAPQSMQAPSMDLISQMLEREENG
ncbi:MAG: phage tail assembly chaperone [Erythrobacter sp.]|uniref:phage tail assembly chaperone n=1 Tax=Erythrobacter sp. TaxID=1042 RepID=UPI003267010C